MIKVNCKRFYSYAVELSKYVHVQLHFCSSFASMQMHILVERILFYHSENVLVDRSKFCGFYFWFMKYGVMWLSSQCNIKFFWWPSSFLFRGWEWDDIDIWEGNEGCTAWCICTNCPAHSFPNQVTSTNNIVKKAERLCDQAWLLSYMVGLFWFKLQISGVIKIMQYLVLTVFTNNLRWISTKLSWFWRDSSWTRIRNTARIILWLWFVLLHQWSWVGTNFGI